MLPLAIFGLGVPELLIILAVVLLLFGGSRLAGLGKSTGRALKEFKEETKDLKGEKGEDQGQVASAETPVPPQTYQQPQINQAPINQAPINQAPSYEQPQTHQVPSYEQPQVHQAPSYEQPPTHQQPATHQQPTQPQVYQQPPATPTNPDGSEIRKDS
jgi:sec-independent protein translocase protein TatA